MADLTVLQTDLVIHKLQIDRIRQSNVHEHLASSHREGVTQRQAQCGLQHRMRT